MPAPTDRHRHLAETVIAASTPGELVERVARLLADEDDRRVPVQAVAAAYGRGRRDAARDALAAFRDWLEGDGYRHTPPGVDVDPDAALIALDAYQETRTDD